MVDVRISELPAATSVAATDLFEVSQGGSPYTSRKATGTQVQSFVLGSYAGASTITTLGTIGTGAWQATTISVTYGGTGASTAAGARTNLGAAASGANSDITSLSGLTTALSVAQGGTGATTAANARTNLGLGTAATMIGPSGAIVGTTDTQTLSGKTLTNPVVTNYTETLVSSTGSTTIDLANGTVFKITTNGATTITLPTSVVGKSYVIIVAYGGAHTITWAGGSTIKWAGGTGPTVTSVNAKFDIFTFFCDGTNTYGSIFGQNF